MPALKPTDTTGTITWLGVNADRTDTLRNRALASVDITFAGFQGESRGGVTRPSCNRVIDLHPVGTEIRNTRQISIVSAEELAQIAAAMDLPAIDPAWLGAGMVIGGLPDFSHIPPSTRLQGPDGATLVVDMENRPCNLPAKVINEDAPGMGRTFKTAAQGLRGIMAWVEREGVLRMGDEMKVFLPDQPVWAP